MSHVTPHKTPDIFDSHREAAFDFGRCVLLPSQGLHRSGYNISHGSDCEYGCLIYSHSEGFSYCEPYTDESYNSVDNADRGVPSNVVAYTHTHSHPAKNPLRNRCQFSSKDYGFSIKKCSIISLLSR